MALQQTPNNTDRILRFQLADRRQHRRHDLDGRGIAVYRADGPKLADYSKDAASRSKKGASKAAASDDTKPIGTLIDISAGGIRFRTDNADIATNQQIRIRLELPSFAGINPFVDATGSHLKPKREWTGWMHVVRTSNAGGYYEVAGRLVDMDELDRGMLSLYLSTQPLAA